MTCATPRSGGDSPHGAYRLQLGPPAPLRRRRRGLGWFSLQAGESTERPTDGAHRRRAAIRVTARRAPPGEVRREVAQRGPDARPAPPAPPSNAGLVAAARARPVRAGARARDQERPVGACRRAARAARGSGTSGARARARAARPRAGARRGRPPRGRAPGRRSRGVPHDVTGSAGAGAGSCLRERVVERRDPQPGRSRGEHRGEPRDALVPVCPSSSVSSATTHSPPSRTRGGRAATKSVRVGARLRGGALRVVGRAVDRPGLVAALGQPCGVSR